MNIAEGFIKRPVMTTLVMAAILLFGIVGYRSLPVSDLPSVDYPTIQVSANLPGASPATMASAVATPLEKQGSGMLRGAADADGLIVISEETRTLDAGDIVRVLPLPGWPG